MEHLTAIYQLAMTSAVISIIDFLNEPFPFSQLLQLEFNCPELNGVTVNMAKYRYLHMGRSDLLCVLYDSCMTLVSTV